ncbi:TPA: hypothetical protein ACNU2B_002521, partial [Aeromonas salmonicida subsp. salmonicida]
ALLMGRERPLLTSWPVNCHFRFGAIDSPVTPSCFGIRLFAEKMSKHLFEKAFLILYSSCNLITKN